MDLEKLKYPIGKYTYSENPGSLFLSESLIAIQELPEKLRESIKGLNIEQLNTKYRDGGWTILQVINHLADSHMNAFIRLKLALTENNPTIKPYDEAKWAATADGMENNYDYSMKILEGLHHRWANLILSLKKEEFNKTYYHPESERKVSILEFLGLYAWHSKHHVAHITTFRERMKW